MPVFQTEIALTAPARGFHLVTEKITGPLQKTSIKSGLLNVFIRHTSASLALNENADPDVRRDMEAFFLRMAPDGAGYFRHTMEGPDDMTSHIKNVIIGSSLQIPWIDGRPGLGTWQGIYLCEHRSRPTPRKILITLLGD